MPIVASPYDPFLLDPRHQHDIDGAHLALRWEPAPGAVRYRVQIALDPEFFDVVLEQDLPPRTEALVVRQRFPAVGRTFYWRALAGNARGWSEGDRVESFVCGSADQGGRFVAADEAGYFGPVAALFRSATLETMALEASAEVLPGRQPGSEQAPGEGHSASVQAAERFTVELHLLVAGAVLLVAVLVPLLAGC